MSDLTFRVPKKALHSFDALLVYVRIFGTVRLRLNREQTVEAPARLDKSRVAVQFVPAESIMLSRIELLLSENEVVVHKFRHSLLMGPNLPLRLVFIPPTMKKPKQGSQGTFFVSNSNRLRQIRCRHPRDRAKTL